jgi:hypothetical protein
VNEPDSLSLGSWSFESLLAVIDGATLRSHQLRCPFVDLAGVHVFMSILQSNKDTWLMQYLSIATCLRVSRPRRSF